MTERAEYRWVVKEFANGAPFLCFETLRDEIPALEGKLVARPPRCWPLGNGLKINDTGSEVSASGN